MAEQAKEHSRRYKAELQPLEALLARLSAQIETREEAQQAYETLQCEIVEQQNAQRQQQQQLSDLNQQQQQYLQWQQQLAHVQQSSEQSKRVLIDNQTALKAARQQLKQTESVLSQAEEIQQRCAQIATLRQAEEQQAERFDSYQVAQGERLRLHQQIAESQRRQQHSIAKIEGQLSQIQAQEQALQTVFAKKEEIALKLAHLRKARKELHQLDKKRRKALHCGSACDKLKGN